MHSVFETFQWCRFPFPDIRKWYPADTVLEIYAEPFSNDRMIKAMRAFFNKLPRQDR